MNTDLTRDEIARAATSPLFAALARAELALPELESWDAGLRRDPRLLVPIDVRALVVTTQNGQQAVETETVLPIPQEGGDPSQAMPIPPQPFGPAVNRRPGIHLHWAMPDGLTRGDAGSAGEGAVPAGNPLGLPSLPDRWVVVRLVSSETTLRAWVLEADRAEHHDLAGWSEPGPLPADTLAGLSGRRVIPRERLTSVAGGDVAWAATYDAVIDRFAFYDDLSDLKLRAPDALEVAYLVAGWWSDPALDPLHDCTSVGAYLDRTQELGWLAPQPDGLTGDAVERDSQRTRREALQVPSPAVQKSGRVARGGPLGEAVADVTLIPDELLDERAELLIARGPAMPRLTLLHGSVLGVSLRPGPDLAPNPASIELAVGPTGFAALSALLADGSAEARVSSERVLAAFASGLLAGIDAPGGLPAIDEDRHASAFIAISTGARARPDRIAEGDVMAAGKGAAPIGKGGAVEVKGDTAHESLKVVLLRRERGSVEEAAYKKRFGETKGRPATPRTYRDVRVPNPRAFTPADLAFVLRGAVRSLRHGGDGRFTPAGLLACRLPGQVVRGLHGLLDGSQIPRGLRSLGSGAVPPEVDLLLRETVLTDPYRWREVVEWVQVVRGIGGDSVASRIKAELALRYTTPKSRGREPELDDAVADKLRAASLVDGVDVSPVGVTRWQQPWTPLWCDWEIELTVSDRLEGWELAPVDLEQVRLPDSPPVARTVRGRALLTSAAAHALAGQIRAWLVDEDARDKAGQSRITEPREAELAAAATAAEGLDVLAGTFRGLRETLLGLDPVDAARARIDASGAPLSKPLARDLPLLLAGGQAVIRRMRIIDGFGRWRDLPPEHLKAAEIATQSGHPDGAPNLTLPPRFQRPSLLALRFVDPRTADGAPEVEARIDQQFPAQVVSPLAGWLLPDYVDEALEFFDASGMSLGQLMHDELTGAVMWEGAPGRADPVGAPPNPGPDPGARHLTRLAVGAVAADAAARNDPDGPPEESALTALLRAIDTTLWTVDPLGSVGTGAVAGLVGRPIAVVRAILRLDVQDDVDLLDYPDGASRQARLDAYTALAERAIAVRLGELTRSDDGLLTYAVNDDYSRLRVVAPEVLSEARVSGRMQGQLSVYGQGSQDRPGIRPIRHPYLDPLGRLALHPGQTVRLTLLMSPGGKLHCTSGVLPRKSLALARDWFQDSLVRLSPSFRVGPVLVDPTTVRLPLITGLGDKQVFTRRDTPLTWRDDPISAATQTAFLPEMPSTLQEGWIRVQQVEDDAQTGRQTA